MNVVDITSIVGALVIILSSLLVPWLLRRQKTKQSAAATTVVSWQGITAVLQQEKQALRQELQEQTIAHRTLISDMQTDHARQIDVLQSKLTQREAEIATLYRQLYENRKPQG